jgi:DNA-directed RNA polymerase subunit F
MENDKLKKFIKTTIREFLNENVNNYIKWDSLSNSVKNDITENIYHNNKYVEKNYWNPESFKDTINDLTHEHQPKFKVEYKDTNELYNELTQIGWGISEKNVERLISILRNGDEFITIIYTQVFIKY